MKPIIRVFKAYHILATIACVIGGVAFRDEVIMIAFLCNACVHMMLYVLTIILEDELG